MRNPVFTFQVITPYVPLEIIGTICGFPFYYRGRHDRWSVYNSLMDFAEHGNVIAKGETDNGRECELNFAFLRILHAFEEQLSKMDVIV